MVDEKQVRKALKKVKHPKLQKAFVDLGMIRNILIERAVVKLTVALKGKNPTVQDTIKQEIKDTLLAFPDITTVKVKFTTLSPKEIDRLFPKAPLKGIENVRHIIAVASGKGGVGKTTIAVNLALALHKENFKVGLLDADVYGPSIPVMLALPETPASESDIVTPIEKFGLHVMSIGMAVKQGQPIIWRGPLVSKMIRNMLDLVQWDDLDYLVIDLPPGTGDPSITLAKALPQCSIVMVTTPQEVALADVRRAIGLFQKTGTTIIGLIENMSYFLCDQSKAPIEIFGHGGGEKLSKDTGLPLLGNIPLDLELRQGGDIGIPLMLSSPNSPTGRIFQMIAHEIAKQI